MKFNSLEEVKKKTRTSKKSKYQKANQFQIVKSHISFAKQPQFIFIHLEQH